jgi:hypothetical protein
MRKYPLIVVSICAVVLLVLASLSNVVGYQSVKSTVVNDSPLFQTRTQRAMNQQQNILTSQYLGKGKNCNLLILIRLNKTDSVHEIIRRIQSMDDNSFQRVVEIVEQFSIQKDIPPHQLILGLYQIRNNPRAFIDDIRSNKENPTWRYTPTLCWFPGCVITYIIFGVLWVLLWIYLFIQMMIKSSKTESDWLSVCFCPY